MTREALAAWLEEHCQDVSVSALANPAELEKRAGVAREADVIVLNVGSARVNDGEVRATLNRLEQSSAGLPLVLLSDREEIEEVVDAVRCGARGFIPTSLGLDEAVEALRFVRAGGTFVPARTLMRLAQDRQPSPDEEQGGKRAFGRLTPREIEVLARLRQGKPNKVIAHELEISESTVKVFVRRILIKLQAVNRTEVAYMTHRRFEELDLILREPATALGKT